MKRDLATFFTGIVIAIVLTILSLILGFIFGAIFTVMGFSTKLMVFSISIIVFLFVSVPYSLITTYFIYDTIDKIEAKRFGVLGDTIASGILCWLFNIWALPYVLYAKIWPVEYIPLKIPNPNKKRNFFIGWGLGLFISLCLLAGRIYYQLNK